MVTQSRKKAIITLYINVKHLGDSE